MAPAERPNLLFVLTDQQRFDWVGTNPEVPVRTPNYDDLVDRGVEFTNAVCPAPLCAPSRSCLASGLEYHNSPVRWNTDYPLERGTYYGRLRDEAGYAVSGVGDIDLHMDSPTWGLDGTYMLERMGFSDGVEIPGKLAMVGTYRSHLADTGHVEYDPAALPPGVEPGADEPTNAYMAYLADRGLLEAYVDDMTDREPFATTRPSPIPHRDYVDSWVGRRAAEFLEDAPRDRPWHLAVNFVGPHAPMDVSAEMHRWNRDPDVRFPAPVDPAGDFDGATHQEIRRNYAAMIENIDRWLGRYVETLRDRGELGETVVVFASDHGELLGDHGGWNKLSPRRASVGVPLAVAGPGVEARGRDPEPVSLLDLHATFLDYGGVDPGPVDSRSLRPYLAGEQADHRDVVRSAIDPWRLVDDGRYTLVLGHGTDVDPGLTGELAKWFREEHPDDRERAIADRLAEAEPLLFDREADPHQATNVAGDNPAVVESLREYVDSPSG